MAMSNVISGIRAEKGLTQEEMARDLFVTRQAVSRWELGESTPGIDMVKLICVTYGVPLERFFEMPASYYCQCCSMPIPDPALHGSEADGSPSGSYCKFCYQNGEFTSTGLDEIIERNVPYLTAATDFTEEEAVSFMSALLPTLKHWKDAKNDNIPGNVSKGQFYACPNCGNILWAMGQLNVTCCGEPLRPLSARKNEGVLNAEVEVSDGCQVATIDYPMTKEDHLSFIACVSTDLVRIKRLYPQQQAQASFFMQGRCKLYAYGTQVGLVEL